MANWRDQKRKALAQVHSAFEIPAVYLTHAAGTPLRVLVRLHRKQIVSEQQIDDWTNAGKLLDTADRIVFAPTAPTNVLRNAFVIFGNSEAYQTGPSKPERDGYRWVEVSEVSQADLNNLLADLDTSDPAIWEGIIT